MASFAYNSDSDSDLEVDVDEDVQLGFLLFEKNDQLRDGASDGCELFVQSNWAEWDGGNVGGIPLWLDPRSIPLSSQLQCSHCKSQLVHLLHLYCPLDEPDNAFHRALYLFICRNGSCVEKGGSVRCFRSQLSRDNAFYPYVSEDGEAVDENYPRDSGSHPYHSSLGHLCEVCGCHAPNVCAGCSNARYCSRAHQRHAWKLGHRLKCTGTDSASVGDEQEQERPPVLFPTFELIVEDEVLDVSKATPTIPDSAAIVAANAEAEVRGGTSTGSSSDVCVDTEVTTEDIEVTRDFENAMSRGNINKSRDDQAHDEESDRTYRRFMRRVRMGGSDQVIRYQRWTRDGPLILHAGSYPGPVRLDGTSTLPAIPSCPKCGAERLLEFQVMPQLLHFLKVGGGSIVDSSSVNEDGNTETHKSIDWGTLDVWTCTASCDQPSGELGGYLEEYVTRQSPLVHAVTKGSPTSNHELG